MTAKTTGDRDFALLVGKAFLREVERGDTQSATAFGRAFLLSLGMKGPTENKENHIVNGRSIGQAPIPAEN